jgi:4-hydroxy-3-polyprenylbenzoate decarboxylase
MAKDLRAFLTKLEERGQLRRITVPVDPHLEIAEIANRLLLSGGPALLFENVKGATMPLAINTLGTLERVCWSFGMEGRKSWRRSAKNWRCSISPAPQEHFASDRSGQGPV